METIKLENKSKKQAELAAAKDIVDGFFTIKKVNGREIHIGVDKELKKLLQILIAMGINTESSCWGHLSDHNGLHENPSLMPNVVISGNLPDREYTYDDIEKAAKEADAFELTLNKLLKEFYRERALSDERAKIVVDRFEGMPSFKLRSATDNEIRNLPTKTKLLISELSHKEWRDFSLFLENKFIE